MATRTIIQIVDDTTGETADETVQFALDGVIYEIDLSDTNAEALRDTLGPWIEHSRRTKGPRLARRSHVPAQDSRGQHDEFSGADRAAMRRWGAANGFTINKVGRVPMELRNRWIEAGRPT